ncbi:MAG: hypothetical protein IT379_01230 [Deltaproteobacteria bacterium]|nr:hypothetical protein [Deltaproteobacteria bacterium]
MFSDYLRDVVHGTDGGFAGLLMGFDGIAVEQYAREDASVDIATVGMEFSHIISQIRKAAEMLDAGVTREIAIQAEKMTTVVRVLNDEYFLALALEPTGNVGKGRYLLRIAAPKFLSELE